VTEKTRFTIDAEERMLAATESVISGLESQIRDREAEIRAHEAALARETRRISGLVADCRSEIARMERVRSGYVANRAVLTGDQS